MTSSLLRNSPSGPLLGRVLNTDQVLDSSGLVGTTFTGALNYLRNKQIQYLDGLDSPIALYNFNDTLNAVIGGANLSSGGGSPSFTDVVPGVRALIVPQGANVQSAILPMFQLAGDVSAEVLMVLDEDANDTYVIQCGATGETEATNYQWSLVFPSLTTPRNMQVFWETGLGVNNSYTTPQTSGSPSRPWIHNVMSVGFSRASNIIQMYLNGLPFGLPSAPQTPPTGGSTTRLQIGGETTTNPAALIIMSAAVYDRGRSASEWLASYNRSLGPGLGFI